MKLLIWPFHSQQDKRTGKFLLNSDSGVRTCEQLVLGACREGWDTVLLLPPEKACAGTVCTPYGCTVVRFPHLEVSNFQRRYQWSPRFIDTLPTCDAAFVQHEFMTVPLRALRPDMKLILEVGIRPDTAWSGDEDLFAIAKRRADLLACTSAQLQREQVTDVRTSVWNFGWSDILLYHPKLERCYDVVFPARASSTNYSNHTLFLEACNNFRAIATDPTSYLRSLRSPMVTPNPLTRGEYLNTLAESRVVLGLTDNGYGGYAFQEAVALGCTPVALDVPAYRDLLGDDAFYCEPNVDSVRDAVGKALSGWVDRERLMERMKKCSYSEVWKVARGDIYDLCR